MVEFNLHIHILFTNKKDDIKFELYYNCLSFINILLFQSMIKPLLCGIQ